MDILYKTQATASAGREGRVRSENPTLDLGLSVPREMGGPGGEGTNPEQLFAATYAACFGGAVKLVAGFKKMRTGPVEITAKVDFGHTNHKYGVAVELVGHMPELTPEQAMELMQAAHEVCPYSNATRGNVDVQLSVA